MDALKGGKRKVGVRMVWLRRLLMAAVTVAIPVAAAASGLDDYYLSRFAQLYGGTRSSAVGMEIAGGAVTRGERCLTPLYHELKRDWKQLAPATQNALAKYVTRPTASWSNSFVTQTAHFNVHYTTVGADAADPAWTLTVANTFENVYNYEVATVLGYHAPPPSSPTDGRYDVYLQDLAATNEYGYTVNESFSSSSSFPYAATSYIVIDKAYTASVYTGDVGGPYTPLQSLQVTAAHEFHHTVQYGYNFYFDIWYAEATSTWMEDEVYDSVNQLYNYLPAYFANSSLSLDTAVSTSTGGGYGRWIFNRYLAEHYGTREVVKNYWERLATTTPPADGRDISAVPVLAQTLSVGYSGNLGADFLGLARRAYVRDWTSHGSEVGLIPAVVPAATVSSFPSDGSAVQAPAVTLPGLSFVYFRYLPGVGAPSSLVLKTDNLASGTVAVAFRKDAAGITEYAAAPGGATITIPAFTASTTQEVMLLICNTSLATTASTTPPPAVSAATGGGGGGCFIATAAYGSYLDPKVAVLREFRDTCLLTNALGRLLVASYYRLSPPLAACIARHDSVRLVCRLFLTPVVWGVENKRGVLALCLLLVVPGAVTVARRRLRRPVEM
ncbi:MAG TPA: MXAN_6640 family putative metalloprotease [Geobacteraceae bacterium]